MPPKGVTHREYDVHGDDVESLLAGFAQIQMPTERWNAALEIVREVLVANDVAQFCWYKPPNTAQLCGYWDEAEVNMIWISPSEVHINALTHRPQRAPNLHRADGAEVGWLLPGATPGSGGGARSSNTSAPLCPVWNIEVPVGSECMFCGVEHG